METFKDFLSQMPMVWRVIVYVGGLICGLIFWTWFVFRYPTSGDKDKLRANPLLENQTNIGSVAGDYVGRDKNVQLMSTGNNSPVTYIDKQIVNTAPKTEMINDIVNIPNALGKESQGPGLIMEGKRSNMLEQDCIEKIVAS